MSPNDDPAQAQAVAAIGGDYPRTYREFRSMFPNEDACAAYLERLRWPRVLVCPRCGVAESPWRQTRGRLVCSGCRRQTTVTAGTILDKTRTPLITWFEAAWHVATAKNGLSATTLERTLGVSYRTAWAMLHRFRVAMVRSERERLSGDVEVDETMAGATYGSRIQPSGSHIRRRRLDPGTVCREPYVGERTW